MEQELKIYDNIVSGKTYKNLYLKSKYNKDSRGNFVIKDGKKETLFQGLDDGNFVIVTKSQYAEGKKFEKVAYDSFLCNVNYKGTECTIWFTQPKADKLGTLETEYMKYCLTGGVGDKVKITLKKELKINKKTGAENLVDTLLFERV
jgi:hypothetical protein